MNQFSCKIDSYNFIIMNTVATLLFIMASASASMALPITQLPVSQVAGSCVDQSLDDGSTLSLCKDQRSSKLYYQNSSMPSVLLASVSSSEVDIPVSFRMLTGYVCEIILHNTKYGQDCFDSAESVGLEALMPGNGNSFPSDTFSLMATESKVVGQPGTCFEGSDRLVFSGLTPQAQLLVLKARNGKVLECDLTEFTPRIFMGAMWTGVTIILPVLVCTGLVLAFTVGLTPYGLLGGTAKKSTDD